MNEDNSVYEYEQNRDFSDIKRRLKYLKRRRESYEKILRDILIPLFAGVISGLVVKSSLSFISEIIITGIGVAVIILFVLLFSILDSKNGLRSSKVKTDITKTLQQNKLQIDELVEELDHSKHKIYYNLQELEQIGEVTTEDRNKQAYVLIEKVSEQQDRTGRPVEMSSYPPDFP